MGGRMWGAIVALGLGLSAQAGESPTEPQEPAPVAATWRMAGWLPSPLKVGYVLRPASLVDHRAVFIDVVRSTGRNLWILDASYDRDVPSRWTAKEIHVMKLTDPQRRILASLSVATAETWREYWEPAWAESSARPDWLLAPREGDPSVWSVKWWSPEWQAIVSEEIDGVVARGFDGVLITGLDEVLSHETVRDVFQPGAVNPATKRPWRADMADWVTKVASYARGAAVGKFMVVGQDAPELLTQPAYAASVDGVLVQDMFRYGPERVGYMEQFIRPFVDGGGTVLVLEDQRGAAMAAAAASNVRGLSMLFSGGERSNLGVTTPPR
jgi:uncharacterized protein (TIGR01370 family)